MGVLEDLYGGQEAIQNEKVADVSIVEEGNYTGVIGKIYPQKGKTRDAIVCDIFLWQRTNEEEGKELRLMNFKNAGGVMTLDYIIDEKKKEPVISGTMFKLRLASVIDGDPQGTQAFFIFQRKKFAKLLGGLIEKNEAAGQMEDEIDWRKIATSSPGRLCSFTLKKAKGFLNLELDSMQVYEVGLIKLENILELYKTYTEYELAKKAKKSQFPSSDVPTPDSEF